MADVEYEFNSQVDTTITKIQNVPQPNILAPDGFFDLYATFKWTNSINVRTGFEYRLDDVWAVMAGYTWLQNAVNRTYPTGFGAPAGDNHIGSLGARYRADDWEMNLAYTYRMSEATIVEADLEGQEVCNTCQFAGDYALTLQGVHLDFSYDF
jgi:long-subunit fatty acid transport protein